jgi:hypothetical protein
MSAGKGVLHSEYNPSRDEAVHLLQIWIEPDVKGIAPGYEQRHIAPEEKRGRLRLIASPEGREGSVAIHQDAKVYAALLDGTDAVAHPLGRGRRAYVHAARGSVRVNGRGLHAGDALKISDETTVALDAATDAEVLFFDLP